MRKLTFFRIEEHDADFTCELSLLSFLWHCLSNGKYDNYTCLNRCDVFLTMIKSNQAASLTARFVSKILLNYSHYISITVISNKLQYSFRIALIDVILTWNYNQVRSMKRGRDIRDQLEGLLEKVEIELVSNPSNLDTIKKAITSGIQFCSDSVDIFINFLCTITDIKAFFRIFPPCCKAPEDWCLPNS